MFNANKFIAVLKESRDMLRVQRNAYLIIRRAYEDAWNRNAIRAILVQRVREMRKAATEYDRQRSWIQ